MAGLGFDCSTFAVSTQRLSLDLLDLCEIVQFPLTVVLVLENHGDAMSYLFSDDREEVDRPLRNLRVQCACIIFPWNARESHAQPWKSSAA